MARTPKPATPTKPRTRKPKAETPAAEPAPAPVEYSPKELELRARYPHQDIIAQSYRVAGGREGWGHKHTVEVRCAIEGCTHTRVLATSDLQWQTSRYCLNGCAKRIKQNHRATKAEKKKLK